MKKYILIAVVTLTQSVFATDFYEQLCAFNGNWEKYEKRVSKQEAHVFKSDFNYIQTHLKEVISILVSNPTNHLTAQQKKNRFNLIRLLGIYRNRGLFPVNNYREERIPVFIDEHNTHCAVGYLLKHTGNPEIAREIANTNNYAWVKEIEHPKLSEWQNRSGFTLEEIKLIQGAYDFYPVLDLHDPNKYEIPQKPEFMTLYFDREKGDKSKRKHIWCKGEGKNGKLHGRWEQNYSETLPWIVGYFNMGKRTGQWKEYYQGTDKLCRTENWRNNKLNGVRKRFNKSGDIIEEILFKNGVAVTKTNYDLDQSLKYIRTPLDSNTVWTEVYTIGGSQLAYGEEKIYNPGNLMWFQNIELTALNTVAITSRELQSKQDFSGRKKEMYMNPETGTGLYNAPPLVEYKKVGEWVYYKDFNADQNQVSGSPFRAMLHTNFPYLSRTFIDLPYALRGIEVAESYDSLVLSYEDNKVHDFKGYGDEAFIHIIADYHQVETLQLAALFNRYHYSQSSQDYFQTEMVQRLKMVGQYDEFENRIGTWKYYNKQNQLSKTETYLIPWREEEELNVVVHDAN